MFYKDEFRAEVENTSQAGGTPSGGGGMKEIKTCSKIGKSGR